MNMDHPKGLRRIVQESVPGKQITIAHVIASPGADIPQRIGVDATEALGILTLTPSETAIIAADYCVKVAPVSLGFVDRFTGSVVITGELDAVTHALQSVVEMFEENLNFSVVKVSRS